MTPKRTCYDAPIRPPFRVNYTSSILGRSYFITVKVIDVEKGRVDIAGEGKAPTIDLLDEGVDAVIGQVVGE